MNKRKAAIAGTVAMVAIATVGVAGSMGTATAHSTFRVQTQNGGDVLVRSQPTAEAPSVGRIANGTRLTVLCQTTGAPAAGRFGTSKVWNKLREGQYVSDSNVYTGSNNILPGMSCSESVEGQPPAATAPKAPTAPNEWNQCFTSRANFDVSEPPVPQRIATLSPWVEVCLRDGYISSVKQDAGVTPTSWAKWMGWKFNVSPSVAVSGDGSTAVWETPGSYEACPINAPACLPEGHFTLRATIRSPRETGTDGIRPLVDWQPDCTNVMCALEWRRTS